VKAGRALGAVASVAAAPALVTYALAALSVAQGRVSLSYAGASPALGVATVGVGLALAASALVTVAITPSLRVGPIAMAAALLWFAPLWLGWYHGPALVLSVAAVAAPFWLPTTVHCLLRCPDGRVASAVESWVVRLGYAGTALFAGGLALMRDPLRDINCWADCQVQLFLVHPEPDLASAVATCGLWFAATFAALAALLAGLRVVRAPSNGASWLVLVTSVAVAAASTGYAVARTRLPLEDPSDQLFRAVYATRIGATALLALTVMASVGIAVSRRRAVAELAQAPEGGRVEAALRRTTGDPTLTVAYWLPVSKRYVDAQGRPVAEPTPADGRTTTPLVRGRRLVAVIVHSPGVRGVERSLGSGLRLALENNALRAEILAQLADVQDSRRRLVAAADGHRRTLERNLHDGAQQDLAALLYRLRARARTAPEPGVARAAAVVEAALDELRSIAHGIYPAVLDHAGLPAALATLADTADVPVELDDRLPWRRYSPLVERTAYLVVAEAIASAKGVTHVAVSAHEDGGRLVITVSGTAMAQHLADRVGAAGGQVIPFGDQTRVELPCEW